MRLQSTPAEVADGTPPEGPAGNIDFAANAPPHPFFLFRSQYATHFFNRPDKLMPRNTTKIVIAVQQLHVGFTDARKPHAHQCPSRPQFWQRPRYCIQFFIFDAEAQHGAIYLVFFLSLRDCDLAGSALRPGAAIFSSRSNLASNRTRRGS